MEHVNVHPDVTAYNFIVLGYASQGDADKAIELSKRMQVGGEDIHSNIASQEQINPCTHLPFLFPRPPPPTTTTTAIATANNRGRV